MERKIIVGISGVSGAPLAVDVLKSLHQAGVRIHLVITPGGELTLRHECDCSPEDLAPLCEQVYSPDAMDSAIASGTFRTDGMIVVPASMKTVAGIANGYSDNLLLRAADVTLKECRRLIVVPRECPLSGIHLRNLLTLSQAGAVIVPPVISCYSHPENIQEMMHHITCKILDLLNYPTKDYHRWEGS